MYLRFQWPNSHYSSQILTRSDVISNAGLFRQSVFPPIRHEFGSFIGIEANNNDVAAQDLLLMFEGFKRVFLHPDVQINKCGIPEFESRGYVDLPQTYVFARSVDASTIITDERQAIDADPGTEFYLCAINAQITAGDEAEPI